MSTTYYDARVRVLGCERCGAPLAVPLEGGRAPCGYCGSVHVVEARPTTPVGESQAPAMPEAERLALLRKQRDELLVPPAALRGLLRGGHLAPGRENEALRLFGRARESAHADAGEENETLLFALSIIVSNHYAKKRDHTRARAILESAVERLRTPRHRQVLYGTLARFAAREGEHEAAEQWASMLDARSKDLPTDTAYRLTHAILATHRKQPDRVLALLGSKFEDVPISSMSEPLCALVRAHAIEQFQSADAAAHELARAAGRRLGGWLRIERTRQVHAGSGLELCPASFARARALVPPLRRSWLTVPVVFSLVFLAIVAPLAYDTSRLLTNGDATLGIAGPILLAVVFAWGSRRVVRLFFAWAPRSVDE